MQTDYSFTQLEIIYNNPTVRKIILFLANITQLIVFFW